MAKPKKSPERTLTPVGAAIVAWTAAVELVEEIYEIQHGEVDEGTEAAEHFAELSANEALEHLARFKRFCEDGLAAIDRERARLDKAEARIQGRISWASRKGVEILESLGVKSRAIGAMRVGSRKGSISVRVDETMFDLETAPEEITTVKPAVAAHRVLDKAKAKGYLRADGSLPVPGLELVRGPAKFTVS